MAGLINNKDPQSLFILSKIVEENGSNNFCTIAFFNSCSLKMTYIVFITRAFSKFMQLFYYVMSFNRFVSNKRKKPKEGEKFLLKI